MKLEIAAIVTAVALSGSGCGAEVERLDLRDPRLPLEARRWLADNEDEVAIARAGLDDAWMTLAQTREYKERLEELADDDKFEKGKAGAQGGKAAEAFVDYAHQLVELRQMELAAAEKALELAVARLRRARAETAIRYDLRVYEIEPIVAEVEVKKKEVAKMRQRLETKKAEVEKSADVLWESYGAFVQSGGQTNALWTVERKDEL